MGFSNLFKKKPKAGNDAANDNAAAQGTENKASAGNEKQRQKKIKAMCSKFDETVWNSAVETMKTGMPQFVVMEPDPDIEGAQVAKYVLLGFDTKIVDDFSNKSDDDIGSIMTAIKSSMDCIIEVGLLSNELILMIPTQRTLASLTEFEETFDLKFQIAYVGEDHVIDIETKANSEEPLLVTLPDIRSIVDDGIYVKDKIMELRGGEDTEMRLNDDDNDKAGTQDGGTNGGGDDIYSEDDLPSEDKEEKGPPEEDEAPDEGEPPDETDAEPEASSKPSVDDVRKATSEAVESAENIASHVDDQKDEVVDVTQNMIGPQRTAGAVQKPAPVPTSESGPATNNNNNQEANLGPAQNGVDAIREKTAKLKAEVQKASDEALQNSDVKAAKANIDPQSRTRTFDMAALDQYITRKYFSDDLGLEITSEPFDAMFMQGNMYVPFEESNDGSWLAAHVNSLRQDANTRLAKLHYENVMLMRERYMLIVMKHCETITKSVSTDNPNSRFGHVMNVLSKTRQDDLNKLQEKADAYKRECEQAYQARIKTAMDNAANVAKANFENAHRAEHERELKDIETELRNNIESEYIQSVENLKQERRIEARRQLDTIISETLKLCGDEYTKMLAMERKEYVRLQAVISNFQNENMAAENARVAVQAEEQRRDNVSTKLRKEYDAKYNLANREFEAKLSAVKADIERSNIEHSNYVSELREQHEKLMQGLRDAQAEQLHHKDTEIATLNKQLDTANSQIEMLTKKYSELDDKAGKKYANQIDMLRSEREAWTERAEQVERLHKYTDKIKLTVVIIGAVVMLALGIIIGCAFVANTYNKANNAEQQASVSDTVSNTASDTTPGTLGGDAANNGDEQPEGRR